MATVFDIAARIRERLGPVDNFRLNKLVYYVQAWSLVFREQPAFNERIEAWKDGPVARVLWTDMRYSDARRLNTATPLLPEEAEVVDRVLMHFGQMTAPELIRLTHKEDPWRMARGGIPDHEHSTNEITAESIRKYYEPRWRQALADNAAAAAPPAFAGSIDELEQLLGDD